MEGGGKNVESGAGSTGRMAYRSGASRASCSARYVKPLLATLTCLLFAGCSGNATGATSASGDDALSQPAPARVSALRSVAGKTYVFRGNVTETPRGMEVEERRLQFLSDGSARFGFWINHGYRLSPCRGYSPAHVSIHADGTLTVQSNLNNLQICREQWSFEVAADGVRLIAKDGRVWKQE